MHLQWPGKAGRFGMEVEEFGIEVSKPPIKSPASMTP